MKKAHAEEKPETKENESFSTDHLKDIAGAAAADIANWIKKYPYQTVGGAFALGLILGIFINKKDKN